MKKPAESDRAIWRRAPELMGEVGHRQNRHGSSQVKPRSHGAPGALRDPLRDACQHKRTSTSVSGVHHSEIVKGINP